MIKVLHFADAHIDMVNYGQHDRESGLPVRVMDFLSSLDQIVDAAIEQQVDLVIFAGDAYRNQRPHPRFQRQWQQRIVRLSQAGIPTVLLVGNHDTSPAVGRGHALHEFSTLGVPNVFVAETFALYKPEQLGVPVQVIAIPWISQSALMAKDSVLELGDDELKLTVEERIGRIIDQMIASTDPDLPLIITAHATVTGATWGSERQVMLGRDVQLSQSMLKQESVDYVALGHIHKHQEVGKGHPPIVYPGSIERVDFGEVNENKGYVLANVANGDTTWEFVELNTRDFWSDAIELYDADAFMQTILDQLPPPKKLTGKICRLQLTYPRELEVQLDETEIGRHFRYALSLNIAKRRTDEKRARLGDLVAVEEMSPEELLEKYWQVSGRTPEQAGVMQSLAKEVFGEMLR